MLEDEGYVVVAETGRGDEAVQLVEEHSPDLCVFDIKMPGMDGLAAAREVSSGRKAAVVILTAFSQRSLIEEARDAGVLSYLVKPFQREERGRREVVCRLTYRGRGRQVEAFDDLGVDGARARPKLTAPLPCP